MTPLLDGVQILCPLSEGALILWPPPPLISSPLVLINEHPLTLAWPLRPPQGVCEAHLYQVHKPWASGAIHHKPMGVYDGGPLKFALGEKWASSLLLEQHTSTHLKNHWANFVALKYLWFWFYIEGWLTGLFQSGWYKIAHLINLPCEIKIEDF